MYAILLLLLSTDCGYMWPSYEATTSQYWKRSTFLCHLSPCKSQNHLSYKHESIKWIRGRLPNHQLLPSSTSFNNLYGQYLPAGGPLPLAAPQATGLIPVMHKLGSKLNIKTFCIIFYLLDSIHQNTCIHTYGDGRIVGNGFQGRRDCWPERGSERMGSPQA